MRQEVMGFWDAVPSAGPYANNMHLTPDRQPHQHLITQFFTGQMPFLTLNLQCRSTEGCKSSRGLMFKNFKLILYLFLYYFFHTLYCHILWMLFLSVSLYSVCCILLICCIHLSLCISLLVLRRD